MSDSTPPSSDGGFSALDVGIGLLGCFGLTLVGMLLFVAVVCGRH